MEPLVHFFGGTYRKSAPSQRRLNVLTEHELKNLLGGKGFSLREFWRLGLPVPPGFTITTEVCAFVYRNERRYPPRLHREVRHALKKIETATGRVFGDTQAPPLLVSVRSGARTSMAGMMDTVLDIGITDATIEPLASDLGEWCAWDCYRRLIKMYGSIVLGIHENGFERILEKTMEKKGVSRETDLDLEDIKSLVARYKQAVLEQTKEPFPQDPHEQLWGAIGAVFRSWMNPRAIEYRRIHKVPEDWGTAVTVQAMVFGNGGELSATGVAFTRNPSTGEPGIFGEFLPNAQGEDVVAGIRTPHTLTEAARIASGSNKSSLETLMPDIFGQFVSYANRLERHYRDVVDMEFTVEGGKLWMLQARVAKRTAQAAVKTAVDMANEGLITKEEAIAERIDTITLERLLHPILDPLSSKAMIMGRGLPASIGGASGIAVFSAEEAVKRAAQGAKVILVRTETSPEDIGGMNAAEGFLTTRGGATSHAAIIARQMGKPCVVGAGELRIDYEHGTVTGWDVTVRAGDMISIDGETGEIFGGEIPTIKPEPPAELAVLLEWADEHARMKVRANAETPADARNAIKYGAKGIGLARTEHMFFEGERIVAVREMILADDEAGRRAALAKLLPMQKQDFKEIFEIMAGLSVTIRLLDPPLHEFLPHTKEEIASVAKEMGVKPERLRRRAQELHEFNPMLGLRGCRLGIVYPEIYEMQVRAIFEAAIEVDYSTTAPALLEIMVPLVGTVEEFYAVAGNINRLTFEVMRNDGPIVRFKIGTMIELPRACMTAGKIANSAEFLSFGTNDLTQTVLGVSRDDAGTFLGTYVEKGIMPSDPFVTIDQEGVGEHVQIAVERGRATKKDIKIGACGEHGGDPASIAFFEKVGLDYVSCSPFRVPIARLAAAQAAIAARREKK